MIKEKARDHLDILDNLDTLDHLESMNDGLLDNSTAPQMLDHNALEQGRSYVSVPDALRVHDHDRAAAADPEAWCFAALDPRWAEEESLSLEQRGQQCIERAATPVWRAESPCAHQHMSRVRLHGAGSA